MTHFLDRFPLDFTEPGVQELLATLSRTYWDRDQVIAFIRHVGLSPGAVNLTRSTDLIWPEVLDLARRKDLLRSLLDHVRATDPAIAPKLSELMAADPVTAAPGPGPMDEWSGFDPTGGTEQRIVAGFPTLLGIAFLEQGLCLARSVCRLNTVLAGARHYGTGFRIGPDLLLTNHHVLHDWKRGGQPVAHAEAWFNYELDWELRYRRHCAIACRVDSILGEKAHDWAVIQTAEPIPDDFPALSLSLDRLGPVPKVNERVYIIQHPNGEPKMIGMDHNLIRYADQDKIQYWTDTEPGSSGSPVFDDRWRLVGLHHQAVKIEREGRSPEYRNQGRRIDKVVERMTAVGVV